MFSLLGLFGFMMLCSILWFVFNGAYEHIEGFRAVVDRAFGVLGADDDEAYF